MPTKPKRKPTKPATSLPPRVWLHVTPRGTGTNREWAVIQNTHQRGKNGVAVAVEETKRAALTLAREEGRRLWGGGVPAQVVVHGIDGRIKADATYGADPRRSRG